MADRNVLNRWICVASALALLVAVMTSPLRPLGSDGALSRPDCLQRNFATPPTRFATPPTRSASLSLKSVTLRVAPVKAVCSENEEQLSKAKCPAWCPLGPPLSSSLKTLAWAPAALGLTRASQPLRC
jgi:hypothetical protein